MGRSPYRCCTVRRVTREGREGVTIELDCALPAQAGQFVMVWLPKIDEKPFSIMNEDPLELTIAVVGPFTKALSKVTAGDQIWVRGPYGHGYAVKGERPLLVGGGCGAAPLALLAKQLRRKAKTVTAALGARTATSLMLVDRIRSLGCHVRIATEDGSAGIHGTVIEAIEPILQAGGTDSVYGCGPEAMLERLADSCANLSIPCQVSLERYMRCGMGVCGSCHCGELLVCRDGPAVSSDVWH